MDRDELRQLAQEHLREDTRTLERVPERCLGDLVEAARLLAGCLRSGGTILVCGNGGSAADAQHFATELVGTLTLDRVRPAIPAIALTTDTSLLTAVANDFGVERMFARQVEALGSPGDALVAISTSGTSPNVVAAAEEARARGVAVVSLTGVSGGKLGPASDVSIRVPSDVTAHVQTAHLAIEHALALLIERQLHP